MKRSKSVETLERYKKANYDCIRVTRQAVDRLAFKTAVNFDIRLAESSKKKLLCFFDQYPKLFLSRISQIDVCRLGFA